MNTMTPDERDVGPWNGRRQALPVDVIADGAQPCAQIGVSAGQYRRENGQALWCHVYERECTRSAAHTRVDDVPHEMTLVQLPATGWEILLENEALLDVRGLEQSPPRGVMRLRVQGVAQLEHQQPLDAFVDAEIVWLGDPHAAVVTDFDQVLVLDGISQTVVERGCSASHVGNVGAGRAYILGRRARKWSQPFQAALHDGRTRLRTIIRAGFRSFDDVPPPRGFENFFRALGPLAVVAVYRH